MKLWSRFLLAIFSALLVSAGYSQTLNITGISASPSSAAPGDSVTVTLTVGNSDSAADFRGTATFSVKFTNINTGQNFTLTSAAISPVGGVVSKAVTDPQSGQTTPGTGSFTFSGAVPVSTTEAGGFGATATITGVSVGGGVNNSFSVSTAVLTVTGQPDLQITSLTYAAGTAYTGGMVIPMQLTYRNNIATNGDANVPYTPGINGHPTFVRVKVVLSSNPTFGDTDDFQLTILDLHSGNVGTTDNAGNPVVNADGSEHTFNWFQALPGNFTGSYYVLAKMDSLEALPENDPPALTINGNNVWGGNALNPTGTLINLLPSNFPAQQLASHASSSSNSASGYSDNPSISTDGRYVAFASDASNLVTGDTNGTRDVFVFDSQTTLVRRLSLSQQGAQGNGASNDPKISGNGRYVVFATDANNLIIGDTNGFSDIYVADTLTGQTQRMSVATGGAQANNPSFRPAIDSTGRYIVFESTATNLDADYAVVAGSSHIYLHDRDVSGSGVFDTAGNTATRLVDVDATAPGSAPANGASIQATISTDGTEIAFASRGTNLVSPATTPGRQHVYLRPRANVGSATSNVRLLSVANGTGAEGDADSQTPSLSSDGHYVAFASLATNLVAGDTNGVSDVFVYDTTQAVGIPVVRRMSVTSTGGQGYDPSPAGFRLGSINPTLSSDGRYVAFASLDANLTPGDLNGQFQGGGATATASVGGGAIASYVVTSQGSQYSQSNPPIVIISDPTGSGASATAVVSAGGQITSINVDAGGSGYTSPTIIIASDTNRALDIFVHDRDAAGTGTFDTGATTTQMVSVNTFGYQTNGLLGTPSTAASNIYPVISANGRFVAFPTDAENNAGLAFGATNLLPLDSNGLRDIFLFDRRTTANVTPGTPPAVTITNPGNGGTVLVNSPTTVTASATTNVGVVASVQFFVDGTSIGSSSAFPYSASWTPSAVGNYTLSALVTDSFGNIGVSPNVTVTVVAAPSVGITSPVSSVPVTVGTPQTVTAAAAASNPGASITSVQFFVDGTAIAPAVTAAPYTVTWTPSATGTATLTAVAIDSVGTQSTSPAVAITVNAVGGGGGGGGPAAPSASVTSPPSGSTLTINTPQVITASASSNSGGTITGVQFLANGNVIGSSSTFPYRFTWTPTGTGTVALTVVATDSSGSTATSMASVVTVAPGGTPPVITLTSPGSGSTYSIGSPITLSATTSLGTAAISGVEFFVNGFSQGSLTSPPFTNTFTPTAGGTYTIVAVATDITGNQTSSAPASITVTAGAAPSVSIAAPIGGSTLPVNVEQFIIANVAATNASIVNVQFFANSVALGTVSTFPYIQPWTPTGPGTYLLSAVATDTQGVQTTSAVVSVTVSGGAAPTVNVSSPTAGSTVAVNSPVTLMATASSTGSVVKSVEFLVNGVSVGAADTTFPYSATWTPQATGTYTIVARATDESGNISTSPAIGVTAASSSPPTVSVTNPTNGSSFTVGTALTLSANAADSDGTIASVLFLVNGIPQGSPDTTAPYAAAWTPGSVGVYTVTAQATDSTGNLVVSAPVSVTIGANAAPTLSLTSPTAGLSYGLGTQVLVAATANDADGTVASVDFFANGLLIGTATAAPFAVSWKPTAAGNYTLTAVATDNIGNITTSAPTSITVTAAAAPSASITNPVDGSSFGVGTPIPVVATTTGGNGPIAQVQFYANGAPLGSADATSPYSATFTPAAPGTYTLLAVATDSAGISANSAPVTVTIRGNAPPTIAITAPASGTTIAGGTAVSLTADAADSDGTVASVRYLANGNVIATASAAPFTGTWTPTAPGNYTIVAQATDNSGNVTNSASVTVSVSANRGPAVSLTSPGNGSTVRVGSGATLAATATDPDGTITSVQFLANGVPVGAADTTAPYNTPWTPTAEGIYRITALATDNSGTTTTSVPLTVLAVGTGATDAVYTGTYLGADESGRFALISVRGNSGALIAYSTSPTGRIYFFPALTLDAAGGFVATDSSGRVMASGSVNDTGVVGTLDNNRATLIGPAVFPSGGASVAAGYYNGNLTSNPASTFAAIVAADGSIAIFATDGGSFRDAGSGTVTSTGAFAVTTPAGNRFSGTIDPATGFLTGSLSGGPGGGIMAANAAGSSFSDGFLRNLSTRGQVGTGANLLIAGFVVAGDAPKKVLIRAIGPSLASFGVAGALVDTQLEIFNGSTRIASNDNWSGDGAVQNASTSVGAFPLSPSSFDSALLLTLSPGSYTAQVSGVAGRTGIALVELYDADSLQPFSPQKVTNVATRGVVGAGQNQLIAGFVVSGNTPKKVLVRAVGPTLGGAPFNVAGVLADPVLRLVRGESQIVRENDNWEQGNDVALLNSAASRVGAFPLTAGSRDAAILINLPPGTYSAQVTGTGTSTGVALVEVYEVP